MSIIKEINRRKAEARKENDGRMQLCWLCRKAVATEGCHCSWSRDLEPVTGWTAAKTEGTNFDQYYVMQCPDFLPDEIVYAHAMGSIQNNKPELVLFRFMNEVKQHYGVLDEDTARFVINHCALHDDKLRKMGYSVERGLTVEPPVGGGGSEPIRRNETSKMCCGTCRYYQRQNAVTGYGYACVRTGIDWKRYGDFCPYWFHRRPKDRKRVHHSYMDPTASLKGGCKMRDCIYSGALSGAELDTASRSTLYCKYSQIEGHCRTVDGEHYIENGRCDLYQRDHEKRKRFMAKKKKKEMTRIKMAVEKTGGTE